jgi:MoxR-like ATPase
MDLTNNTRSKGVPRGNEQNVDDRSNDMLTLIPKHVKKYIRRKLTSEKEDIQVLKEAYKGRQNTLLIGPTGAGKTHAIRLVAKELGTPYIRLNLNRMTTVEDFVGQWVPKKGGGYKWNDGVLTRLMRHGGVVVVDEINAAPPEILFVLHSVTDDERQIVLTQKDGEVVKAHPDFWFVATMAPEYRGTEKLNQALKDRFEVVLQYPYDISIEGQLLKDEWLVRAGEKLREQKEIKTPVSTRMLLQLERNQDIYGTELTVEMLISKFEPEEQQIVREILEPLIQCKKEEEIQVKKSGKAEPENKSRRRKSPNRKDISPKEEEKLEGIYSPCGKGGGEERYFKEIIERDDIRRQEQIARMLRQLRLDVENQWQTRTKGGRIDLKSAIKAEKNGNTRTFKKCKPFRHKGAKFLSLILVDESGSMIGWKSHSPHRLALKLAWSLSEAFEREGNEVLVMQFNTDCKLIKDLSGKLTHGLIPGGGTDPAKALSMVKSKLDEIRHNDRKLKPLVIILTDAIYPISDGVTEAVEALRREGAKIVEVKIPNNVPGSFKESKKYAEGREKSYDYVYGISSPDELIPGLQELLESIETEFLQTHT